MQKSKSVPLQAWSGPEGSAKLRFPDFMTTAQGGGKATGRQHRGCIVPQTVTHSLVLLKMGKIIARNMLS